MPETQDVREGFGLYLVSSNKPCLHYDEVSDQGVGSELSVDSLDEVIRDVRVGAGQESSSAD